jgi:acetoin utilization protein AcuB
MKQMPTIQKFMTVSPHTINAELTLDKAEVMMREHRIRHLPVLKGGKLVGVVTDRDLRMVESFKDVDPTKVKIEEAFTPEPYTVSPSAPVDEVAREMARHKYGCALVVDNNKLVGIFTWIDALIAMDSILQQRFHH